MPAELEWCRCFPVPLSSSSCSSDCNDLLSSSLLDPQVAFLYIAWWRHGAVEGATTTAALVKVEDVQNTSSSSSVDEGTQLLQQHSLTVYLVHLSGSVSLTTIWKCEVESLEQIRPPYMTNKTAFFTTLRAVLCDYSSASVSDHISHDAASSKVMSLLVFPARPTAETRIARVDVRLTTRDGNASVAICSFHCSNAALEGIASTDPNTKDLKPLPAASQLYQTLSAHLDAQARRLHSAQAAELAARRTELQMQAMTKALLEDQEVLLQGFVAVLNAKKEKIRALTSELEIARQREAHLSQQLQLYGGGALQQPHAFQLSDGEDISDVECVVGEAAPLLGKKRSRENDDEETRGKTTKEAAVSRGVSEDSLDDVRSKPTQKDVARTPGKPALQQRGSLDTLLDL